MSEVDSRFVKQGLWTDLEKGSVMGKTITTDTQTGAFVIALLAILSSLATAHLWHLVTFLIHQLRADGRARDALFRQQQAILRTLPTPGALVADSLKLYWHWKSKEGKWLAIARVSLLVLLSGLFVAMTWAASIFSSLAVDTSNLRVLVNSPQCGFINMTFDNLNEISLNYLTEILTTAEPFADQCYLSQNSSLPGLCDALVRPRHIFTTEAVECPWDSSMCAGGDEPAIRIDSGLIDLNDFGLNLPAKDRVQVRKSTTCGVVSLENRTMIINASDMEELNRQPLPQEELMMLFLGDTLYYETWKNATFFWSLSEANTTTRFDSQVMLASGPPWFEYGNMVALPEMQRNDTDIVFRMIAKNYVTYRTPVEDLVFSAHRTNQWISSYGTKSDRYYADDPVSVIACGQQLNALPAKPTRENFPQASSVQLAALQLVVTSESMFDQSSPKSFDADDGNWYGDIASLPDNQWEKEVTRWEAIAWSGLHHMIADYAIGPKHRDPNADSYVVPPTTPGQKQLCQSQRMQKNGGFVNINFFALIFVVTVSTFVVILDITLLKFLIFLSEFQRLTGLSRHLSRWTQDGVLQLQRRAYEAQGRGLWENLDEDVPLTAEKLRLDDLPEQS
ncbi:hypothetical protein K458DRAFT_342341, partial [Lentithecium fluviatile CBS 122367]